MVEPKKIIKGKVYWRCRKTLDIPPEHLIASEVGYTQIDGSKAAAVSWNGDTLTCEVYLEDQENHLYDNEKEAWEAYLTYTEEKCALLAGRCREIREIVNNF